VRRWICASVDLDPVSAYLIRRGRAPAPAGSADPVYTDCLERFLELFAALSIPATFFSLGAPLAAACNAAGLIQAVRAGHEVGNHSNSHPNDLRLLDDGALRAEIDLAEQAIVTQVGTRPVGFRAPGWNLDRRVLVHLAQRGYLYDSSLVPLPIKPSLALWKRLLGPRLPWPMLAGQLRWPRGPTAPYRLDLERPWRPGRGALWEVPCGAAGLWPLPLNLSLHHLLGDGLAGILERLAPLTAQPLVLVMHGLDLAEDELLHALALGKAGLDAPLGLRRTRVRRFLEVLGRGRSWCSLRDLAVQRGAVGLVESPRGR